MNASNDNGRPAGGLKPDMTGEILEIDFEMHWSTRLVSAWNNLRRIKQTLGWNMTVQREPLQEKGKGARKL